MKKMTLKMWLLGGMAAFSMLLGGCAQGVDSEPFLPGVTNAQLESPAADSFQVSITASGGSETLKVSWPVVMGAGGYYCSAYDVTDEANPIVVFEPQQVDGSKFQFPISEDRRYEYSVKTLGNKQYNNADAATASSGSYFHGVEAELTIPDGEELGAFIAAEVAAKAEAWAAARAEDFNFEVAYDLVPGGQYTLTTPLDLGLQTVRIRTLSENRATVTLSGDGHFSPYAGLRLQAMNIDCTDLEKDALIRLNDNPDASIKDENLLIMNNPANGTYKAAGATRGAYIIEKPIEIRDCWVKELTKSLLHCGGQPYGVTDFRVTNSIVQMNNSGTNIIELQKKNCQVKNMSFYKTTLFNMVKSGKFFLALPGQNHTAVFGTAGLGGKWEFEQSTIVMHKDYDKKVGDRTRDSKSESSITNCIFVNMREVTNSNNGFMNLKVYRNNTIFHHAMPGDSKQYDADYLALGVDPIDPGFDMNMTAIDFSQPNAGVNFTPTGNALADRRGDPRWLPAEAE